MSEAMNGIDGGMAAVIGLSSDEISDVCNELSDDSQVIQPVNFNSENQSLNIDIKKLKQNVLHRYEDYFSKNEKSLNPFIDIMTLAAIIAKVAKCIFPIYFLL